MIEENLSKLGLSNKEIALYLAVLQKGRLDVPEASRITGINRTTVYSVAKELETKGYITQDLGSKPNALVAVPPENLRGMVERQKNLVENLIPELHATSKDTPFSAPKIKFIPEVDLEQYLYDRTAEWEKSLTETDGTWWGSQDPSFAATYSKWIDWYWKRPEGKQFKVKIITNSNKMDLAQTYEQRNVMLWGEDVNFTAATWVLGHYIVLIMYTQKPNYLIEIYDSSLAHNLREVFKGIWRKPQKAT